MECEAASEAEDKMRPPKSGEGDSTVLQTTIEVGRYGQLLSPTKSEVTTKLVILWEVVLWEVFL